MYPDIAKSPLVENPPFFQGVHFILLKCKFQNMYLSLPSQAPNISPLPSGSVPPFIRPQTARISGSNQHRIYQVRKRHSGQSSPFRHKRPQGTQCLGPAGVGCAQHRQPTFSQPFLGPDNNPTPRKVPTLLLSKCGKRPAVWGGRKGASKGKKSSTYKTQPHHP